MKRVLACLILAVVVAGLFAGLLGSPGVRAATGTVTWTSTADFDNGTKGTSAMPGSWATANPLIQYESDASGAALNGNVYVIGGAKNAAPIYLNTLQILNTGTGAWSFGPTMPTARLGTAAVTWADRVYSIGGETTGPANSNATEFYNSTSGSWGSGSVVPVKIKAGACAVEWNGLIYLYGIDGGANSAVLYQYNPGADSWTAKAAPTGTEQFVVCGVVGNFLYIVTETGKAVKRYDFNGNSWNNAYDVAPFPFFGSGTGGNVYQGKIYIGFGFSHSATVAWQPFYRMLFSYDPVLKVWTRQADATYARDGVALAWSAGRLYAAGGRAQNPVNGTNRVEVFSPAGSTGDAVPGVETSTDSAAVSSGAFQIASTQADYFATPKANAESWKWNFSVTQTGNCQPSITGGNLSVLVGDAQANGLCAVIQNSTYSGDLDFQVQATATSGLGGTMDFHVLNEPCPYYSCDSTVDGFLWQVTGHPTRSLNAYTIANGLVTQCGVTVNGLTMSLYGRITYTAGTGSWSFYRSTDGVNWTLVASCTNLQTGPWNTVLTREFTDGTGPVYWDNFRVAAGSPQVRSFRPSASWTSPLRAYAQQVVSNVHLDFTGATAAETIASVAVVDSTGAVIEQTSTPISSGTAYDWPVPFMSGLRKDWSVQVSLAGDGAGSVSVLDVIVTTASPPGSAGGSPSWSIACSFNPFFLSWTCTDSTDYTNFAVVSLTWKYDNVTVATTDPDATVSFRAPGQSWASPPGDHRLTVQAYGGTQAYTTLQLHAEETFVWAFLLVVFALVAAVGARRVLQIGDRDTYYMPLRNPSYRQTAISVEEYPKGWRSYRQRDPDRYVRLRSRRRGNLWVVYGIRPATAAEQERTGRKYIAEVQTVREKL